MIPYSRPKRSDLYTLSQSKLLENHTLHSGTYPYSPYMAVPPPRVSLSSGCLSSLFLWSRNFATMGTQWRPISPTPGTRGCLACDEELRRPQADTSSAEVRIHKRRIQKSQHLSRGSLFKTWPTPGTAWKASGTFGYSVLLSIDTKDINKRMI